MKVSVWMSAYNHGKYISRCLESVLMQKTDFDFEIVIGEDCSADNTREIIKDFAVRFPDKVKPFFPEKNIGMMQMDVATFSRCRGEYLALLNGDDEWTDEKKLQIQADLLDSENDASMCYHRSFVIDELSGQEWETEFTGIGNELPAEKLFHGFNPIMTASVMCRNPEKLPDWYEDVPYGDMPLYLMLSEQGKIRYIDRTMCLYRIHARGNWQGDTLKSNLLKDIKYYNVINEKFDQRYSPFIKKILALRYLSLTILSLRNDEFDDADKYYNEMLKCDREFLEKRNTEVQTLRKILDDNSLKKNYSELIGSDPGWKII